MVHAQRWMNGFNQKRNFIHLALSSPRRDIGCVYGEKRKREERQCDERRANKNSEALAAWSGVAQPLFLFKQNTNITQQSAHHSLVTHSQSP